jgi:uncharacterized protein
MQKAFQYKGLVYKSDDQLIIKDIDEKEGRIRGYFAVFGNVDSDGDMIMPGAFKRSLTNNLRRIKHLWQHNPWQPLSSAGGGTLTLTEDNHGLFFDSVLNKTSWGKDALECYLSGTVDEQSIGFVTVNQNQKGSYNEITEVKLFEGSTVTWAANELARTESIKSLTKEQAFERMNVSLKAFREGKYENEEIFEYLDIYVKQLQQHIIDLSQPISTQPAIIAPDPQQTKGEDLLIVNASIENLLIKLKTL